MKVEDLIDKWEGRKTILTDEHEKMLGIKITSLKESVEFITECFSEFTDDLKKLNEAIVSEDDSFEGNKYHFIYDSGDITINCQCGLSYTIEKE